MNPRLPHNKDAYLDPSRNLNCLSVMDIYHESHVLFADPCQDPRFLPPERSTPTDAPSKRTHFSVTPPDAHPWSLFHDVSNYAAPSPFHPFKALRNRGPLCHSFVDATVVGKSNGHSGDFIVASRKCFQCGFDVTSLRRNVRQVENCWGRDVAAGFMERLTLREGFSAVNWRRE